MICLFALTEMDGEMMREDPLLIVNSIICQYSIQYVSHRFSKFAKATYHFNGEKWVIFLAQLNDALISEEFIEITDFLKFKIGEARQN